MKKVYLPCVALLGMLALPADAHFVNYYAPLPTEIYDGGFHSEWEVYEWLSDKKFYGKMKDDRGRVYEIMITSSDGELDYYDDDGYNEACSRRFSFVEIRGGRAIFLNDYYGGDVLTIDKVNKTMRYEPKFGFWGPCTLTYRPPTLEELVDKADKIYDDGDHKAAFDIYFDAAKKGHVGAQYMTGRCYWYGNGVASNRSEAEKWLLKAYQGGRKADAVAVLTDLYESAEQYAKLAELYKKEYGGVNNPDMYYKIGNYYDLSENSGEAVDWYNKAALSGNLPSIKKLYEYHKYTTHDDEMIKMWAKKGAEMGDAEMAYAMAELTEDKADRLWWLVKASSCGSLPACFDLGKYYLEERNEISAANYFEKLTASDDGYLLVQIAELYYGKHRVREAEKWYLKALEKGDWFVGGLMDIYLARKTYSKLITLCERRDDQFRLMHSSYLAKAYLRSRQNAKAEKMLKEIAANEGTSDRSMALRMLYDYYSDGKYVAMDPKLALQYSDQLETVEIEAAKEMANAESMGSATDTLAVGTAMEDVEIIPFNLDEQMESIKKESAQRRAKVLPVLKSEENIYALAQRANQGDVQSMVELADLYYYKDEYYGQDYKNALQWYDRAANSGNGYASGVMARLLLCSGREQNAPIFQRLDHELKAYTDNRGKYASVLANSSEPQEKLLSVLCIENGYGELPNGKEALKQMQKLAKAGNSDAKLELSRYYREGLLTKPDEKQMLKSAREAAEAGNVNAMKTMALYCLQGVGMPADEAEAEQWIGKAVAAVGQGNNEFPESHTYFFRPAKVPSDVYLSIAEAFTRGYIVSKDSKKANKWRTRAAEAGDIESCKLLMDLGEYNLAQKYVKMWRENVEKTWEKMPGGEERMIPWNKLSELEKFLLSWNMGYETRGNQQEAFRYLILLANDGNDYAIEFCKQKGLHWLGE